MFNVLFKKDVFLASKIASLFFCGHIFLRCLCEKALLEEERQQNMHEALENVRVLAGKLEIVQNALDRAEATKKELEAINKTKDSSLDMLRLKHTNAVEENTQLFQDLAEMKEKSEELNRMLLSCNFKI